MRRPLTEVADVDKGGRQRMQAEKRKRDDEDTKDVRDFTKWYDSAQYREIKRVAGLEKDLSVAGAAPVIGVGGSVVKEDDFFTALKKKHSKAGDDSRLVGTVVGRPAEDREVIVEGGPVQRIRDWKPPVQLDTPRHEERSANIQALSITSKDESVTERAETSPSDVTMQGDDAPA